MAEKYCFVTVGATAVFEDLIRAVLQASFLSALRKLEYTNLVVQFGGGSQELFKSLAQAASSSGTYGLKIQGFTYTTKMRETMRIAKGEAGRFEGVVLCHAGTGSVLDAMRIGVPVVVVPNPTLLNNHQVEFAEQMARMQYAVHGDIANLTRSLQESEELRKKMSSMPPPNAGLRQQCVGLKGIIDEELGIELNLD